MWPERTFYEGSFLDGNLHGKGVCVFSDGSRYEGEWTMNKKGRFGKYVWPDGSFYDGNVGK